ncbi:MAG TPA: Gfo/Idh/MocA family oxidoreductase [Steroidobacteraceae bacterium]
MHELAPVVGLVGFGFAARTLHLPLIASAGMSVGAILTRQAAAAQAALPAARVVADMTSLLAVKPLDLVVIATPNHLHAPQGLAALAAGKHVVIDKPLALSTCEAGTLMEAAERHDCRLAVFQNRRWDSDFLTLRRIVAEHRLGTLHSFEARWDRYRPAVPDRWRERAEYGGGVLFDLGSHLIDQALCLFGMPQWLEAQVLTQRRGAAVDDGFEIRMGRDELRITLGAGSLVTDNALRYRLHGSDASYRKTGVDVQEQQLRAGVSPVDPIFGMEPAAQWGRLVRGGSGSEEPIAAERGCWREFYVSMRHSIETGSAVPVDAAQARNVLYLIEAVRRSSATACRVSL